LNRNLLLAVFALATTVATAAVLAGCGSSGGDTFTIYSGRSSGLVAPLYERFEQKTGIDVEVKYGESPELAATIQEEGANSPADVFYAQDAGAIGSVSSEGLLAPLPAGLADKVAEPYRDGEGRWTGVTGRVRTAVYNTEEVAESELPDSVLDLTAPEWKGRVGIAPGNASFEGFVTAMRLTVGDEQTEQWMQDMKANDVKTYEKNTQIVEAAARGEIDVGLVNHYYLFEHKSEQPDSPVENHFFEEGDPGTLVNVSAAGILASAKHKQDAQKFMEFLLSEGQEYFATEAEEREYAMVEGYPPPEGLPPLNEIKSPKVNLSEFGAELPATVKMIDSIGFSGT
jgi:iron(III) transport system substrate-binding protein